MSRYVSGLVWLAITAVAPLLLLGSYALGAKPTDTIGVFSLATGIFAYVWLLAAVLLASKPTWLDRRSAAMGQVSLLLASLPLSLSHASLSPATSWLAFTGGLALVTLLAGGIYSLLFWLSHQLLGRSFAPSPRLLIWLNRLNLLTVALVFIHVQLIESIRHNLPFMVVFYLMTTLPLVAYFGKKADAVEEEVAENKKLA